MSGWDEQDVPIDPEHARVAFLLALTAPAIEDPNEVDCRKARISDRTTAYGRGGADDDEPGNEVDCRNCGKPGRGWRARCERTGVCAD
jgi:hypothetical protein